eukprot:CAMPEP_0206409232 /NCGR_PEP_ID=MMETSP0294-20121207/31720_1 /ASSEMBLY_ACC=CAM_ASM_000327 /TAXON_ID=39354 /ORGANISM="Heterosigma akashiwo, Strain CCMP2393" /LENGTH=233 /DNA_ID=CAMNT_0053869039 /DNA_START=108 /DNA_END=810 /DNA_ORIENTATION=+
MRRLAQRCASHHQTTGQGKVQIQLLGLLAPVRGKHCKKAAPRVGWGTYAHYTYTARPGELPLAIPFAVDPVAVLHAATWHLCTCRSKGDGPPAVLLLTTIPLADFHVTSGVSDGEQPLLDTIIPAAFLAQAVMGYKHPRTMTAAFLYLTPCAALYRTPSVLVAFRGHSHPKPYFFKVSSIATPPVGAPTGKSGHTHTRLLAWPGFQTPAYSSPEFKVCTPYPSARPGEATWPS